MFIDSLVVHMMHSTLNRGKDIENDGDLLYMNCYTGEYLYADKEQSSDWLEIPVPLIQDVEEDAFLNQCCSKRMQRKLIRQEDGTVRMRDFFYFIGDFDLDDDWRDFWHSYMQCKALEWCYLNNIKFLMKTPSTKEFMPMKFTKINIL